jgi:hypothetical protein
LFANDRQHLTKRERKSDVIRLARHHDKGVHLPCSTRRD